MPTLFKPHLRFKESYLIALDEFNQEGLWEDQDREFLNARFYDFIDEFSKNSKGLGLPLGWVASTEYWWAEGDHFIGRINVRHRLTDQLKKFGGHIGYEVRKSERNRGHATKMLNTLLPLIKELNIENALITCDSNNIASQKVIISAGGKFQDEIINEDQEFPTQRYWIDLKI